MADEFTFRVSETPTEVSVSITGTVDERSELAVPDPRGRRVVIDAQGIRHMNSMGVHAWIDMMDRLSKQTRDVVLTNLTAILVTQSSMISTFIGNAKVHSFLSPWICPSCEHQTEKLHGGADAVPQSIQCPQCGSAMDLDWDREAFLGFR